MPFVKQPVGYPEPGEIRFRFARLLPGEPVTLVRGMCVGVNGSWVTWKDLDEEDEVFKTRGLCAMWPTIETALCSFIRRSFYRAVAKAFRAGEENVRSDSHQNDPNTLKSTLSDVFEIFRLYEEIIKERCSAGG